MAERASTMHPLWPGRDDRRQALRERIRINHMGKKYFFPIIESFLPEHDTIKGDKPLKKGSWWLMIKVTNERIWKDIEDGKLTGFSMGGTAKA